MIATHLHEMHVRTSAERLLAAGPAKVAVVLGSGLASFADRVEGGATTPYHELPGWSATAVSGHGGFVRTGTVAGRPVHVLCGRSHYYERGDAAAMRIPIETLKRAGVQVLVLTNAAGSLREDMPPGSVMMLVDHINWSGRNPLIGETGSDRFVDMRDAYDPGLRHVLGTLVADVGEALHEGVYMWFSGPSFETPAEIRMAQILGAHAVGMSTVPEVILARRHGLRVAALSAITNMGAGLSDERLSHAHTQEQALLAAGTMSSFLAGLIQAVG